ncbi:endonuclease domain-containing protein [Streptomyces sp. NPDC021562]|uniref:endonuclease domain-containing protein n=1 Tax=Streptomyces sp. NPDC021562 TaxID=3155121 RepID=UPI0033CBE547
MSGSEETKRCSRCKKHRPRAAFAGRARQIAKGRNVRPRVAAPEGHKYCRTCGETKPHGEWHRNATASDGLSTGCKACRAVKSRADHLKRDYGLTEAERDAMLASRYGICTICPSAPPAHVDHCHKTGRVRGVLCFNCNSAIGTLRDDPDAARRAAAYLEGNLWKPTLVAPGVYQLPS